MTRAAFSQAGLQGQWIPQSWISGPKVTDLFLTAAIVLLGLPQTICEKVYVGAVPLLYVLQYAAAVGIVVEKIASRRGQGTSWWPTAALLLGVYMGIAGWAREAETKWWVVDATMYGGFLLGMVWCQLRGAESVARTIRLWGAIAAVLVAANVVGLATGLIAPVADTERKYTGALFNITGFVAVAFPFWFVALRRGAAGLDGVVRVMPACLGIASVVAAAYLSATRSLLIVASLSILFAYWASAKDRLWAALVAVIASAGLLIAAQTGAFAAVAGSLLAERLSETSLADEARYVEVEMLYDDLTSADDTWWGRGFGSRFTSNVVIDGDDRAFAPHIGALAPWFKGGLPAFGFMIVLPALAAVSGLFLDRGGSPRQAGRAGMLTFLTLACLSGGWDSTLLFLYGVFLASSQNDQPEGEPCAFSPW